MADRKDRRPGGGGGDAQTVLYHDEADGTWSMAEAAHLRGWDADSSLTWIRVLVDSSGRLVTSPGKTLLNASIDISSSGDNTIVAADGTKKIKVVSYAIVAAGTVNVRWKSGATNKSGAMPLVANTGVALAGAADSPLLETAVNNALILNLSGAVGLTGHLSYYLEA